MLLNLSVFMWFGAVAPWYHFAHNDIIPIYRLIFLGILILLFRRIPIIFILHKKIHQIEEFQQAAFVGFFGPIGVSAVFYLYVCLDFLAQVTVDGEEREDAKKLGEVMMIVVWFLAICSIVVHGLSVPLGKLGYNLPRTISSAFSTSLENPDPSPFQLQDVARSNDEPDLSRHQGPRRRINQQVLPRPGTFGLGRGKDQEPARPVFKVGGRSIPNTPAGGVKFENDEPDRPINFGESGPGSGATSAEASSPTEARDLANGWMGVGVGGNGDGGENGNVVGDLESSSPGTRGDAWRKGG
jgi:sodium/hydrogen antiporter